MFIEIIEELYNNLIKFIDIIKYDYNNISRKRIISKTIDYIKGNLEEVLGLRKY